MLKPLTTIYQEREITLECTHKKTFPPPQMYGATPEDIDNLWKQGTLDQNQYQQLKVWQDNCGLMVMGPRCLDCPLALKQNPRPGRPHVIETESWLSAKERMRWADMKAGKLASYEEETVTLQEMPTSEKTPVKKEAPVPVAVVEPEPEPSVVETSEEVSEEIFPEGTMEDAPDEDPEEILKTLEETVSTGSGLDDGILDALAED